MYKPSDARKGLTPQPVYEGHFSDNTALRMTFFQLKDKPWDFARGRRLMQSYARRHGCELAAGYVEHDDPSEPFLRLADNLQETTQKLRAPQARAVLRKVIDQLGMDSLDPEIVAQIRQVLKIT